MRDANMILTDQCNPRVAGCDRLDIRPISSLKANAPEVQFGSSKKVLQQA